MWGEKFLFSPQILEGQFQIGSKILRKKSFLLSFWLRIQRHQRYDEFFVSCSVLRSKKLLATARRTKFAIELCTCFWARTFTIQKIASRGVTTLSFSFDPPQVLKCRITLRKKLVFSLKNRNFRKF